MPIESFSIPISLNKFLNDTKYEERVSKATVLRVMVSYFYENPELLKSLLDELKGKDKIKYVRAKRKWELEKESNYQNL